MDSNNNNDQLDFSKAKLVGRDKELIILKSIWNETVGRGEIGRRINNNSKGNRVGLGDTTTTSSSSPPSSKPAPFPLIAGPSGSGKSKLVEKFIEYVDFGMKRSNKQCFFLRGKYEQYQCNDPFKALIAACKDFSNYLLRQSNEKSKIQQDIKNAMGDEAIHILISLVPDLRPILTTAGCDNTAHDNSISNKKQTLLTTPMNDNNDIKNDNANMNKDNNIEKNKNSNNGENLNFSWNQVQYVFETFFSVISSRDHPVIVFIDDLQWADTPSMDLIASLLSNNSMKYFMLIGAMRSNEVTESHPLTSRINTVSTFRPVHRIEIDNLTMSDLEFFVSRVLQLPSKACDSLSNFLYDKTQGNPFFAKEMLQDLHRKGLLYYNTSSKKWEWKNLQSIENTHQVANNVLDVVLSKIKSTPKNLQRALIVAAYTRSTFDFDTLQTLIETTSANNCEGYSDKKLYDLLEMAVLEGILSNSVGSTNYKFAHDRFQQACYSLILQGRQRNQLRMKIGWKLYKMHTLEEGQDWMLFIAADHLNASITKDKDTMFMAHLNLKVGKKALLKAAFIPAKQYLQRSLECMEKLTSSYSLSNSSSRNIYSSAYNTKNKLLNRETKKDNKNKTDILWVKHQDMMLQIYQSMASVELILGNFDVGNQLCLKVFQHAERELDKLPTYLSLTLALGCQERHAEARELHWDALRLLNEHKPSVPAARLVKSLLNVKKLMKKCSNEDIYSLAIVRDENIIIAMKFYDDLAVRSYYVGDIVEFIVVILRQIQLTFKHGLCGCTGTAFAKYGMVLGQLGDETGALRAANIARELNVQNRTKDRKSEAQTLFLIAHFLEPYTVSHSKTMETYRLAHKSGMENGDIEFGVLSATALIQHSHMVGYHLDALNEAFDERETQLLQYSVLSQIGPLEGMRLPVHYLSGKMGMPLSFDWNELRDFGPNLRHQKNKSKSSANIVESDSSKICVDDGDQTIRWLYGCIGRLCIGVYFRKYRFAQEMAEKAISVSKQDSEHYNVIMRIYYSGLAACGLARKEEGEKRIRYFLSAKRFTNQMKNLVKVKGKNLILHKLMLMEAEMMSLSMSLSSLGIKVMGIKTGKCKPHKHQNLHNHGLQYNNRINNYSNHSGSLSQLFEENNETTKPKNKTHQAYLNSIALAVETLHINDAALGSELAGEYIISEVGDKELATKHFTEARNLYRQWGARAKVHELERTRGDYIVSNSNYSPIQSVRKNMNKITNENNSNIFGCNNSFTSKETCISGDITVHSLKSSLSKYVRANTRSLSNSLHNPNRASQRRGRGENGRFMRMSSVLSKDDEELKMIDLEDMEDDSFGVGEVSVDEISVDEVSVASQKTI